MSNHSLPVISFSFMPQGESKSFQRDFRAVAEATSEFFAPLQSTIEVFSLSSTPAQPAKSLEQPVDAWPVFVTLRKWGVDSQQGLSHTFAEHRWSLALDYLDIFETGCDPDKGGHGMSLFFRYNIGK